MEQPARPSDIRTLRDIQARHGFHFTKRLGQHFLTDSRIPEAIAAGAGLTKAHGVLEIGPGLGALTVELSASAGRVVSVEVDKSLIPMLAETLRGLDNVAVVHADILKTDLRALVEEHFSAPRSAEDMVPYKPVVCANLPYHITTPVLARLLEADLFDDITVMVQKEVALRLCAAAGTKEYGAFTVFVAARADCRRLFDVPPHCFTPAPEVTSSVVRLTRRPFPLSDPALFERVVRAGFGQRRKTLVNALSGALALSKSDLSDALVSCGLSPMARGETLDLEAFERLTRALKERRATQAGRSAHDNP